MADRIITIQFILNINYDDDSVLVKSRVIEALLNHIQWLNKQDNVAKEGTHYYKVKPEFIMDWKVLAIGKY